MDGIVSRGRANEVGNLSYPGIKPQLNKKCDLAARLLKLYTLK